MNAAEEGNSPIYDRLIAERGDVVADVARSAERLCRETAEAVDFGAVTGGWGRGITRYPA
ncbi:hypothetical protein [Streptomyces sp. VB1]|uniref:hypothetical protein n=1 Tax=Streptomyces sp. VB1 TaxID=2986803 RepID=UPI002242318A|nr:hypothetical protein [Streptomyces sp. VB1]UZI32781.1 hypothetical protein OH133_34445 [Streptomyces sp. VB1]